MSYLIQAKKLIDERSSTPENKIIEQVRFNSYALQSLKDKLARLYELEYQLSPRDDSWIKQDIVSCKEQIQDLKQAINLLHKAFIDSI
jgi:hypothetical protein